MGFFSPFYVCLPSYMAKRETAAFCWPFRYVYKNETVGRKSCWEYHERISVKWKNDREIESVGTKAILHCSLMCFGTTKDKNNRKIKGIIKRLEKYHSSLTRMSVSISVLSFLLLIHNMHWWITSKYLLCPGRKVIDSTGSQSLLLIFLISFHLL